MKKDSSNQSGMDTKEFKLKNNEKIVLTYGTFDVFHYGHERLLKRIKKECDILIVGVASDDYNRRKGKIALQSEEERFKVINSLPYVDKVIIEDSLEQWGKDFKKYNADEIIMGSDHEGNLDYLREEQDINLNYLSRTEGISTSKLKEELKDKKVVITYGTFDIFHHGHENILKNAKKHGDYLIVGVSSDEFNAAKGKKARDSFYIRYRNVKDSPYVDIAITERDWDQKRSDILKYSADVFIMGDDWKGKFDNLSDVVDVKYEKRTPGISSSMLRGESDK